MCSPLTGCLPACLPRPSSPPPPLPCSKVVRKGIARVLTVVNQKTREALKEAYKGKVGWWVLRRRACCVVPAGASWTSPAG